MHKGRLDVQKELAEMFEKGLVQIYGPALGPLYADVAAFNKSGKISAEELRASLDNLAAGVLQSIVNGTFQAATLHSIRSMLIGAALLGEKDAVKRWATMASPAIAR